MAKPLSLKITGLNETFNALKSNVEAIKKEVDNEMAASVELMATTSKQLFPSGRARIKGETQKYAEIRASIRADKKMPFKYELIAGKGNDPMAAYIEFGTGRYFPKYPGKEKEWQALAKEYYVNGKGWMTPSPYFYPSVTSGLVSLVNNIKQIFKRNERL
jgi:hypothetical protein